MCITSIKKSVYGVNRDVCFPPHLLRKSSERMKRQWCELSCMSSIFLVGNMEGKGGQETGQLSMIREGGTEC